MIPSRTPNVNLRSSEIGPASMGVAVVGGDLKSSLIDVCLASDAGDMK
jgi:hypothetical protein